MFRRFKEKNKKLLRLIQFYIPWEGEGEGGYDENLK
jgi:hypothetical protein